MIIEQTKKEPKLIGGWKTFKTRSGKTVTFFIPLGTKRKRRWCPKCKVKFTLCPYEEKLKIARHYYCSNRCKATISHGCPYPNPPTCGTLTGRIPRCKSCLYYRKSGKCTLKPNLFTNPDAEACENYTNRTHKNK